MATQPLAATPSGDHRSHGRRLIAAWIIVSVVATPLVVVFVGPLLPPGHATTQASQQVTDNTVMTGIVTPIVCLIAVYFGYALISFRAPKGGALVDGPPLRDDAAIRIYWIVITTVVVLFLAGFGTFELLQNGAGGGQGPSPIAVPAGQKLQVQVIAQQWQFTYRYPSYGGFETNQLYLPEHTYIEFHVTSLDVVHSFWAYELGVKADANPRVDNVAYVQTKGPLTFHVRCAELCGLFHGYMYNNGQVVSPQQFRFWAASQQKLYKPIAKYLPSFRDEYLPAPVRRGG
jgi:cytochrome c oxidase subunit II